MIERDKISLAERQADRALGRSIDELARARASLGVPRLVRRSRSGQYRLYVCACRPSFKIRCARHDLLARCDRCEQPFVPLLGGKP